MLSDDKKRTHVVSGPDLRALVLERYASIHAFCRCHPELKRSTVYAVVSGHYPGNLPRQAAIIRAAALGDPRPEITAIPSATQEDVAEALQNIRCNNCRRLDRRNCPECRMQTEREARELYDILFPGGQACQKH